MNLKPIVVAATLMAGACASARSHAPSPDAPAMEPDDAPSAMLPAPIDEAAAPGVGENVPAEAEVAVAALQGDVQRAVEAAAIRFAGDLYGAMRGQPGNINVSPWSAWVALAMTTAGAEGGTRDAMEQLLRVDGLDDPLASVGALARVVAADAGVGGVTWNEANRVYVDGASSSDLNAAFVAEVERVFAATIGQAPFQSDPEGSRRMINAWVSEQTRERIPDLLSPGTIESDTRLVLVNAIYFLADWAEAFDPEQTRDEAFTLGSGSRVDVPMMRREGLMRAAQANGVWAVALPYAGHRFELVVLVPPADGLDAAEELVASGALAPGGALGRLREREVHLWLPKFEIRMNGSLLGPLAAMGLRPGLPFTGMLDGTPLEIADVIQEAFIKTDEEGTEAAAATAVVMRLTSAMPQDEPEVVRVRADRPFLAVLRHTATGAPLFVVRIADPR